MADEVVYKKMTRKADKGLEGKVVASQDSNFKDGRPKKYTSQQIRLALDLLEQGRTYRQITEMTGISKSTLIRAKK